MLGQMGPPLEMRDFSRKVWEIARENKNETLWVLRGLLGNFSYVFRHWNSLKVKQMRSIFILVEHTMSFLIAFRQQSEATIVITLGPVSWSHFKMENGDQLPSTWAGVPDHSQHNDSQGPRPEKMSKFHMCQGRSTPYFGDGHPTFYLGNP